MPPKDPIHILHHRGEDGRLQREERGNATASWATAAEAVAAAAPARAPRESHTFHPDQIQGPTTSYSQSIKSTSAFFKSFYVARQTPEGFLSEDPRCHVPLALSDTGAGPSLLAEGVLAQLPADAVVSRHLTAPHACNSNATGGAIYSTGTVTVVFTLDGFPFQHTFRVIVGGELTILGNDFNRMHNAAYAFSPHDASLNLTHQGKHCLLYTSDAADE